jgi:hypothetical protein
MHIARFFWYQQQQQLPEFSFFFPFPPGVSCWKCIIIVISAQLSK